MSIISNLFRKEQPGKTALSRSPGNRPLKTGTAAVPAAPATTTSRSPVPAGRASTAASASSVSGHTKVHAKGSGLVDSKALPEAKTARGAAGKPAEAAKVSKTKAAAPAFKAGIPFRVWLAALVASLFGRKVIPLPGTQSKKTQPPLPRPPFARQPLVKPPAVAGRNQVLPLSPAPAIHSPNPVQEGLAPGGETTLAALKSLQHVMDRHPRTRMVLKHLAVVEFSLAEQGLLSLLDAPPDIAAKALDQLDIATGSEPDKALAVLRSMLADRACAPLSSTEVSQSEAAPPRKSKFGLPMGSITAAAAAAQDRIAKESARLEAVLAQRDDLPTGFLPTAPGNLEVSDATHSVFAALDVQWQNRYDAGLPPAFVDTQPSTFGPEPPQLGKR